MISREMVAEGLRTGVVSIVDSPNGDGAVCEIGENWFYFGGHEAENCSGKEYAENVPEEDIARAVFETLEGFRECPETFDDEYAYYEAVLVESRDAAEYIKCPRDCIYVEEAGCCSEENGADGGCRFEDELVKLGMDFLDEEVEGLPVCPFYKGAEGRSTDKEEI